MGNTLSPKAAQSAGNVTQLVRYAILGPLQVTFGDRALPLGGPKPRSLLAILLLRRNGHVSAPTLIDRLWGDAPPRTAATTLQTHVSHLRDAIGRETLHSERGGYRLEVTPEQLDAAQFEQAVADLADDGRQSPRTVASCARSALSLWRGDALSDFDDAPWARPEAVRLEGMRQWVTERFVDARLALGDHARLVPELEALVASDPLREALYARLMLALYRCGRQADALRAFERVRCVLREELGLEPSRDLVELERSILLQAHELGDTAATVVSPNGGIHRPRSPVGIAHGVDLPPSLECTDAYVGRDGELTALREVWRDVCNGEEHLVDVVGEPGMGKTRLLAEFARTVAPTGATVLYGACTPSVHIPYQPFIDALDAYAEQLPPKEARDLIGDEIGSLLQRFAPRLACGDEENASLHENDLAAEQRVLFNGFASFFARISNDSPVLFVIDDAHWATTPTLALLHDLLTAREERGLLFVVAHRDVPGAAVIAALSNERPSAVIRLTPLSAKEVDTWLRAARPSATDLGSFAARVWRDTEGVPLFVREFLRSIATHDQPLWPPKPDIATGVQSVLDERWNSLSQGTRALLGVVAAIEPTAPRRVLERVAGLPHDWAGKSLDEAIASGFLAAVPGQHGNVGFTHRVLRDYVDARLSGLQRATVHRDIALAMQADAEVPGVHELLQLARHYAEAAPLGYTRDATDCAMRAAQHALEEFACGDAIAILTRALSTVDESSSLNRARRVELLLALAEAYKVDSDRVRARQAAREAAVEARGTDPELFARAAVALGDWGEIGEADREPIALLKDALNALADNPSPTRCRVLAELAGTLTLTAGDPAAARPYADEAMALARQLDHQPILWRALLAWVTSRLGEPCVEERLAFAREMTAVGRALGRPSLYLVGMENEQYARAELGDLSGLPEYVDALAHEVECAPLGTRTRSSHELSEPQGMRFAELPLMFARDGAFLALARGDWARAERQVERLGALATNDLNYLHSYGGQLFFLRREQGRSSEFLPDALEIMAAVPHVPAFRAGVTMLAADAGELDIVQEQLSVLMRDGLDALPRGMAWTAQLTLMAEGIAALEDRKAATTLRAPLTALSGHVVVIGTLIVCTGAVDRYLAMLETVLGDYDAAETHFRRALELERRTAAPPLVARTQYWYAHMLLQRNRVEDRARGEELLADASRTASALAMRSLDAHVLALRA